jgi:hypothetical protein
MNYITINALFKRVTIMFAAAMMIAVVPAQAQIRAVDPNEAIGTDTGPQTQTPPPSADDPVTDPADAPPVNEDGVPTDPAPGGEVLKDPNAPPPPTGSGPTYQKDDLIGAAEGVFGKGAKGLAGIIENILKKQGEPNAYIVGREGGGAFVVGLRYGSGTMYHKIEGEKPAYWTGPSIGFDAGANAGSTFVLVYNLYDSEDLYKRFPSAEGVAYLVGGFNASYLRRGDVVLIPIRVGAGLRLGANVGYMKFSKKQRWLPF